jgi:hypothetical protein
MTLGSTQPLREMSASSWGIGRPARKADNLTAICGQIFYKMWKPRRLTTLPKAYYRVNFSFFLLYIEVTII